MTLARVRSSPARNFACPLAFATRQLVAHRGRSQLASSLLTPHPRSVPLVSWTALGHQLEPEGMPASTRTFAAGSFDVFDELAEMLVGWAVPGGPHTADVLHHAGLAAHTRMLDVGCGTGRLLARAARLEPSAVLVGVDTDRDAITIARDRARTAPAPIELHLASADRLPFTVNTFDVATAVFVIGDLGASVRARVLGEIRRVLEPGGRLLVVDWVRGGCTLARIAADAIAAVPLPPVTTRVCPGRVSRMLEDAGFDEVETVHRYCTLAGAAELAVARRPFAA